MGSCSRQDSEQVAIHHPISLSIQDPIKELIMHFSPTSAGGLLLTLGLQSLGALASSTSRTLAERSLFRREDGPEHCIDGTVDAQGTTGNLFCFDSSGNDLTCDECLGLNGNDPARSEDDVHCYISEGDTEELGRRTACPGDPPPEKNPDGTPSTDVIEEGIMDTYCSVAGAGGLFGWTTFAACYSYTFASAHGNPVDEAEAGAKSTL